jgi:hypothetical protein
MSNDELGRRARTTDAHPRVDDPLRRIETAKRRLSFITLTTGGLDDAS